MSRGSSPDRVPVCHLISVRDTKSLLQEDRCFLKTTSRQLRSCESNLVNMTTRSVSFVDYMLLYSLMGSLGLYISLCDAPGR